MKRKLGAKRTGDKPPALRALERAARDAIELARRTGTHAYVLEDGKIVDAAKLPRRTRKTRKSRSA